MLRRGTAWGACNSELVDCDDSDSVYGRQLRPATGCDSTDVPDDLRRLVTATAIAANQPPGATTAARRRLRRQRVACNTSIARSDATDWITRSIACDDAKTRARWTAATRRTGCVNSCTDIDCDDSDRVHRPTAATRPAAATHTAPVDCDDEQRLAPSDLLRPQLAATAIHTVQIDCDDSDVLHGRRLRPGDRLR